LENEIGKSLVSARSLGQLSVAQTGWDADKRPAVRTIRLSKTSKTTFMRTLILAGLACLTLLTGCAQHYVILLQNGNRITTHGKPQLQGSNYVYTDSAGQPGTVSRMRVREIAPASMAGPSSSSGVKNAPAAK
jgi:hypothetical protein